MSNTDISALKKYAEELEKLANDHKIVDEFLKYCVRQMALRTLTRAVKLTPSKTGYLRRGWILEAKAKEPDAKEIKKFISDIRVERNGQEYSITLINNVEYAVYVNYGHKQKIGRYVPAIGKRLKEGWVTGKFFLERTEEWIKENKTRIIREEYEKFLRKHFER